MLLEQHTTDRFLRPVGTRHNDHACLFDGLRSCEAQHENKRLLKREGMSTVQVTEAHTSENRIPRATTPNIQRRTRDLEHWPS